MFENKKKIKFGVYFFILTLILTVTFIISFLESFRHYDTKIEILLIPRNEKVAFYSNQIAQNMAEFTHTLSFYEKLLADNKSIEDNFSDYSKDERKKQWNRKIKTNLKKNSSIIEIGVSDANRIESEKIAKQAVFTLFETASQYYDIKKEIDLRIIDGPITEWKIKNWFYLAGLSFLTGGLLSYLILLLSSKMERILLELKNKDEILSKNHNENKKYKWEFVTQDKKKASNREVISESDNYQFAGKNQEVGTAVKKSQAPSNLPIRNVSPGTFAPVEASADKTTEKEPSEEELKERLNQLLRGEL